MAKKFVYMFSETDENMRDIVGGKGANLGQMTKLGLPIPQGFSISSEACIDFYKSGEKIVGAESGSEKEIDLLELAVEFTENVKKYQPEEFWRTRLQRFFFYFCKNFWFENYVKNKLMNSKTPEESVKILEEYFERVGGDRFKHIVI